MEDKNGIPQALPITTRTFRQTDDSWTCHVLVGDQPVIEDANNVDPKQATANAVQRFVDSLRKVME